MNEQFHTQHVIDKMVQILNCSPWKSEYVPRLLQLRNEADSPCVLAVAGKVKAGKSSFINALLGVDLAMVGTTETTATINYFRYPRQGEDIDPNKPVIVHWNDGRPPEAQTREFLDSLQGHTQDVLEKAERIHHLEYVLKHDKLKYITLVDTPGIGSVEDTHEVRTETFFNPQRATDLRKKQEKASNELTEGADAVLYISMRVPDMGTKKFFGEYVPNITPLNALGVMTKVDNENDATTEIINKMCQDLADSFKHQLSTVIPASAGVYYAMQKLNCEGRLSCLQEQLRRIPESDFNKRFNAANTFLQKEGGYNNLFTKYGLSYEIRKKMVGDMPWMVFFTISKILYSHSIEDAIKYLTDFSGMKKVNEVLERQFFCRSRSIRCSRILKDVQAILLEIKDIKLPILCSYSDNIPYYHKLIDYAKYSYVGTTTKREFPEESLRLLKKLISNNTVPKEECDRLSLEIDSLILDVNNVLKSMSQNSDASEALRLLANNSHLLRNEDEIDELEILFGKYPDKVIEKDETYIRNRQTVWNARLHAVQNNLEYSKLVQFAYKTYSILLKQIKNNNI